MPVLTVIRHDTTYVNQPLLLGLKRKGLDPTSEQSHVGPMKMHMTPSYEVGEGQLYTPQSGGGGVWQGGLSDLWDVLWVKCKVFNPLVTFGPGTLSVFLCFFSTGINSKALRLLSKCWLVLLFCSEPKSYYGRQAVLELSQ